MRISIFGLGYVGCVTAACLTDAEHEVCGVDTNPQKVDMINAGASPIIEPGLDEMILKGRNRGYLHATTDARRAVLATDLTLVCVGTPSQGNGRLHLDAVTAVSEQIGDALGRKNGRHTVVFRSTVLPGTTRNVLIPLLAAASRKEPHRDFDVCFHPEFLREGSSVLDFRQPPVTLIGVDRPEEGRLLATLYDGIDAPLEQTSYEAAEMVKYASNSFHAVKVAFANEVGVLCKALGVDSHRVMELFALDKKLNISAAYLRPGFAFGGSCLPKDVRALLYKAKELDLDVPLLAGALESNRRHLQRVVDRILASKRKRIGVLGLSFKQGTDDLRESPSVALVEALLGKGCHVAVYDSDVYLARLVGANKEFIEKEIPHISALLDSDLDRVVREADLVVVCKKERAFADALQPYLGQKAVLDLVRLRPGPTGSPEQYEGVCW
jgi:GDP-mannose 6-dehydrogenase